VLLDTQIEGQNNGLRYLSDFFFSVVRVRVNYLCPMHFVICHIGPALNAMWYQALKFEALLPPLFYDAIRRLNFPNGTALAPSLKFL